MSADAVSGPVYRALDFVFELATLDDDAARLVAELAPAFDPLRYEATAARRSTGDLRMGAAEQSATVPDADEVARLAIAHLDGTWEVTGGKITVAVPTEGQLVARLVELINQEAAASIDTVPLHAAAVERGGRVIAVAGSSGAGKSTLGAAATLDGWGFVADEIAAVDPVTRRVRAYHRPIGLRRGGAEALGIEYPSDQRFSEVYPWPVAPAMRSDDGELVAIVLVARGDAAPSTVPAARALAELMEHTVVPDLARVPAAFRMVERLVRVVPVVRVAYDTPARGVELLTRLLA